MNQTNLTIIGTGLAITTIIVSTIAVVAGGINDHLATITGQMDVMNGQIEGLRNEMSGRLDTTSGRIDELRNDMREDHRRVQHPTPQRRDRVRQGRTAPRNARTRRAPPGSRCTLKVPGPMTADAPAPNAPGAETTGSPAVAPTPNVQISTFGRLVADPVERTSKVGTNYTTARVAVNVT